MPTTFNDDNNVVALFKVVVPDTFNDDNNAAAAAEVMLFNVVIPDTFNDDITVVILFNVVVPDILYYLKLLFLIHLMIILM